MYYNEEDEKEERGAIFSRADRIYGVIRMLVSAMLAIWLISVLFFAFAQAQEQPEEPTTIEQPKPFEGCELATCSPVRDSWCYNWCEMETVSKADVRHWDGQLWVKHWQACGENLEAWVAYAESLQQQISKCKKWGK